jgi:uncharacterized membrane protein HdeD (DUF308 family)
MHEQILTRASPLLDGIKENASLAVTSGVILFIAGTMALMSPLVAGSSSTIMVGVLLVIGGIGQCILAFKAGAFGRGLLTFIVGLLMTIAGSYMATQPVVGPAALTVILVIYLVIAALFELIMAFQIRPAEGWGSALINSIVTLLLGIMLWRQFPLSGAWAISMVFGVKMIFGGWLLLSIGITAKGEKKPYHLFTY